MDGMGWGFELRVGREGMPNGTIGVNLFRSETLVVRGKTCFER